jgi:hypothetical protein
MTAGRINQIAAVYLAKKCSKNISQEAAPQKNTTRRVSSRALFAALLSPWKVVSTRIQFRGIRPYDRPTIDDFPSPLYKTLANSTHTQRVCARSRVVFRTEREARDT